MVDGICAQERADEGPDAVRVSVVIPCFNSSAYVMEATQSVFAQTLRDFEIVFVDDGSGDDTCVLIERSITANPDVPMRLIRQPNAGTAAARNRGIAAARGRYILPLDADDRIEPTMLEQCGAVLDAHPEIDLAYTDRRDFGDLNATRSAGVFELARLKYFNQLGYCSLYRRSMWQAIGGYRTNVSGFDDWDFWLAAAVRGNRGRHVPQPLFLHRRRVDSLLWRLLPDFERLHAQIILNNSEAYSDVEIVMARRFLDRGETMPMLHLARRIFLARYYEGYAHTSVESSCG